MSIQMLFVHALSPLHAGTGQGVGAIDLPIAREKATNIPYVPGSSIKGVLRDQMPKVATTNANGQPEKDDSTECKAIFGPSAGANASEFAGAVQFADARLLCMPVRSVAGTFAWVTSAFILKRFARDAKDAKVSTPTNPIAIPTGQNCSIATGSSLKVGQKAYLEDLDLTHSESVDTTKWAEAIALQLFPNDPGWQPEFKKRFCIVPDDVMSFLLETATEVVARIALEDDTKTVKDGQLWYEENLPAESVLVSLVLASDSRFSSKPMPAKDVMNAVKTIATGKTMQIGGKANVGRGLCRLVMQGGV